MHLDMLFSGQRSWCLEAIAPYVVPLRHVNDLALAVGEYLAGDKTKLKWLIDFRITPAN